MNCIICKFINRSALPRAEEFYSCQENATPVLHDTAIRLNITRTYDESSIDLLSDEESRETLQVIYNTKSMKLHKWLIFNTSFRLPVAL